MELDRLEVGIKLTQVMTVVNDRWLAQPLLLSQINEEARRQFLEGILGYSTTLDGETGNDETKHLLNRIANVFRDPLETVRGLPSLYSLRKSCFDERLYVALQSLEVLRSMSTGEISEAHQQRDTAEDALVVVLLFHQPCDVLIDRS